MILNMFFQSINAAPIAASPIATTESDILAPTTVPLVSDAVEPFAEFVPLADADPVALATLLDALEDLVVDRADPDELATLELNAVDEAADCVELEETTPDEVVNVEEALVELTPDEVEEAKPVVEEAEPVVDAAVTPDAEAPFPRPVRVAQLDEEGAGCASGVLGSPWWKVEVP